MDFLIIFINKKEISPKILQARDQFSLDLKIIDFISHVTLDNYFKYLEYHSCDELFLSWAEFIFEFNVGHQNEKMTDIFSVRPNFFSVLPKFWVTTWYLFLQSLTGNFLRATQVSHWIFSCWLFLYSIWSFFQFFSFFYI